MKNLILLCLTLITASAFGQAIKPKMMIVPSDAWMTENGFVTEEDEDGAIQKTFEYAEAFQNDPILVGIINKDRALSNSSLEAFVSASVKMKSQFDS